MKMKRIYVINDLCNGCMLCQVICSFFKNKKFSLRGSEIKILRLEDEGKFVPVISDCSFSCMKQGDQSPKCVDLCPTGALIYEDFKGAYNKIRNYEKSKIKQPLFKVIAPWKWPYPWREWKEEDDIDE
jgi:Fe-S-cluster-containing dehydrogenase component